MAYLYRFTCEPNYPVCDGEMIFFNEVFLSDEIALQVAKSLTVGWFSKLEKECAIEYLGEFHPVKAHCKYGENIITLQNGEY